MFARRLPDRYYTPRMVAFSLKDVYVEVHATKVVINHVRGKEHAEQVLEMVGKKLKALMGRGPQA
jgi:hypothetical protein